MIRLSSVVSVCFIFFIFLSSGFAEDRTRKEIQLEQFHKLQEAVRYLNEKYQLEQTNTRENKDELDYKDRQISILSNSDIIFNPIVPAEKDLQCTLDEDLENESSDIYQREYDSFFSDYYDPEVQCPSLYPDDYHEIIIVEGFDYKEESSPTPSPTLGFQENGDINYRASLRQRKQQNIPSNWPQVRDFCYRQVGSMRYQWGDFDCKDFTKWLKVCIAHHAKRLGEPTWNVFPISSPRCRGRCSGMAGRYGHRWGVTFSGAEYCAGEPQSGQYNQCCFAANVENALAKAINCGYNAWCSKHGSRCGTNGSASQVSDERCIGEKCSRINYNKVCSIIGLDYPKLKTFKCNCSFKDGEHVVNDPPFQYKVKSYYNPNNVEKCLTLDPDDETKIITGKFIDCREEAS